MRPTSFRAAALAAYAILTAAACSDSSAPRATSPVSLSFRTGAAAALGVSADPASAAPTGDVRIELGTDAIEITRVAVVVRKIELASTDATACDDDSDLDTDGVDTDGSDDDSRGSEGCTEIEIGPRLVSLPVDATAATTLEVALPQGSYSYMEAKIRPARADDRRDAEFLVANPDLAGVSVVVEGRFNGQPFTYRGRVEAEFERAFDPPLVLDTDGANVGVSVDLATWFRTSDGRLVDPATAGRGGVNEELVARNIKRSFHAFEDEDHDGHDDHGGDDDDSGHGGDDH